MDAAILREAMQKTYVDQGVIESYLPHFEEAMRAAHITTARRAAAWCSQIGHESAGLRYMRETQTDGPGWSADRKSYLGRGPIQLTWSSNYRAFGMWCKTAGYVTDPEIFVKSPQLVEQPRWGFLAASWYWLNGGPRPGRINEYADSGDILAVSRCVNGWRDTPNGMPDRRARWDNCLTLGDRLMPSPTSILPQEGGHAVEEFDRSNEGNSSSRNGARVRLFVLHTEEGNSDAWQLHEWMKRNQVSYHYILAKGVCVDHVNTDRSSWSVLDANPYCINLVFAGSKAGQSRQVWLDRYAAEIDYAARLFVQDAAKYDPLVPLVIGHDEIRAGKAGGTDHFGITKGIGIGSHTDCGPNFPWDVYAAAVQQYATGAGVPVVAAPPVANEIDLMAAAAPWLGERLTVGEIDPGDGRGRLAHFANGSIYWTPTTGARPIPASLFEKFAELNYEHTLGYPVNYHSVLPEGDVQAFENGALYRKRGEPGRWVHGAIGARWFRSGYEDGPLGWPTSDEQPQSDGSILQTFEHGQIFWSPDGVTVLQSAGEPDVSVPDSTH